MYPILFEYTTTDFTGHGIGDLVDAVECTVKCSNEGEYEMELIYPVTGRLFNEFRINRFILAKANHYDNDQIFRIYGYEKTIDGKISVKCQHISYDLINYYTWTLDRWPGDAYSTRITGAVSYVRDLFAYFKKATVTEIFGECPFTFITTVDTRIYPTAPGNAYPGYKIEEPKTIREVLLDGDDSVIGLWPGDMVFDNYTVSYLSAGGEDRGVTIEYGGDLIDVSQDENISEMCTGMLPYWKGEDPDYPDSRGRYKFVQGDILYAQGTFEVQRILPVDLTEYFNDENKGWIYELYPTHMEDKVPIKEVVDYVGGLYFEAQNFGVPEVNITLSYPDIGEKDIRLFDAVHVKFLRMGIDVKTKVVSYTYDVLNERCTEIELGSTKSSRLWKGLFEANKRYGFMPGTSN